MRLQYLVTLIFLIGCASSIIYNNTDINTVKKIVLEKLKKQYKEAIPITAKGIHWTCGKNPKGEIRADFNGDGIEDLAMIIRIGWIGKHEYGDIYNYRFLALLSNGKKGYKEYILCEDYDAHFPVGITLFIQEPGKIEETEAVDNPQTVIVKNPSIGIAYCEMATHVYYWDEKEQNFKVLATSD